MRDLQLSEIAVNALHKLCRNRFMVFGGYINRWNELCHGQVDRKCSRHFSAFPPSMAVTGNVPDISLHFHHPWRSHAYGCSVQPTEMAVNARQILCRASHGKYL